MRDVPSPETEHAVKVVLECETSCRLCAVACLREPDLDPLRECIRLDIDCAGICDVVADYLIRGSPFRAKACALCAEICEACAAECEKHTHARHWIACVDACRRCAEACRSLQGMEG